MARKLSGAIWARGESRPPAPPPFRQRHLQRRRAGLISAGAETLRAAELDLNRRVIRSGSCRAGSGSGTWAGAAARLPPEILPSVIP
ncbi:unnamed protein product [Nesidiocoris tenuis]|uniref:Uncharacterized protein n=1 Tax=Nesidiocoris tenuis TaxID=355587 RepID=A0A6H5HDU6_9HEMI|nr:unnamed protein product [Nesidiocoris tenuis]